MKRLVLIISISINIVLGFLIISGFNFEKSSNCHKTTNAILGDSPVYNHRVTTLEELPSKYGQIVFLGDSITHNNEWHEMFENKNIVNRGISTDTTEGVLKRLDSIVQCQPAKIFIMIGINDLTANKSPEEVFETYKLIINEINVKSPDTKVIIQSVLPLNSELYSGKFVKSEIVDLNTTLKSFSSEKSLTYVDLYSVFLANGELDQKYTSDGIHLNGSGYVQWAKKIKDLVK